MFSLIKNESVGIEDDVPECLLLHPSPRASI